MNLLLNLTNLNRGGAIQVAESIIFEFSKINLKNYDVDRLYIVHNKYIDTCNITFTSDIKFINLEIDSKLIRWITLNRITKENNIHIVFTLFGPAYWKPKVSHISGFALGWVINRDSVAYTSLTKLNRIIKRFDSFIKGNIVSFEADKLIVETSLVKMKTVNYFQCSDSDVEVVNNCFNHNFLTGIEPSNILFKDRKSFKLVTIAANYPHKNLKILNIVSPLIMERFNEEIDFVLTIPDKDYENMFTNEAKKRIINIGPITPEYCPLVYKSCDAVFLPTLLESYTASYPEAMYSKIPILTSNLDFAHELCGDAALYFNPIDAYDIVDKIERIYTDIDLRDNLISKGYSRVINSPNAEDRAKSYLEIIKRFRNNYTK